MKKKRHYTGIPIKFSAGETLLHSIAFFERENMDLRELARLNNLQGPPYTIFVGGQKLYVCVIPLLRIRGQKRGTQQYHQ